MGLSCYLIFSVVFLIKKQHSILILKYHINIYHKTENPFYSSQLSNSVNYYLRVSSSAIAKGSLKEYFVLNQKQSQNQNIVYM